MKSAIQQSILAGCLGLFVCGFFLKRGKTAAAILVGLLPIAGLEVFMHLSLFHSISECNSRAVEAGILPPDSTIGYFGCTEWSSISLFIFWMLGLGMLVGFGIGFFLLRRVLAGPDARDLFPPDPG